MECCPRCGGSRKKLYPDISDVYAYFVLYVELHPLARKAEMAPCSLCCTKAWVKWVERKIHLLTVIIGFMVYHQIGLSDWIDSKLLGLFT